jgi:hypothetical protein
MGWTRDDWVKVLMPVVTAVILVPFGQILWWQWRQPDVRYGTGGAYLPNKLAISSLGLTNWGHSDAEDITIKAVFADPLSDISAGPMGTHFDVTTGGIGAKFVTGTIKGTIKGLVPAESAYLYFITEPSSPGFEPGQFIRGITFKGGQGKTGIPVLYRGLFVLAGGVLGVGVPTAFHFLVGRKTSETYDDHLCEIIRLALDARQEGLSKEQLDARVEERRKKMPLFSRPRKELLLRCAQAAFTAASPYNAPEGR